MGVPRKATAQRAMTRPRICGSAVICSVALPVDRKKMLAAPTRSSAAAAAKTVGITASSSVAAPNTPAATATSRVPVARRPAVMRPPTTAPTPIAAVIQPRAVAPSWNVPVTIAGSDTWNS